MLRKVLYSFVCLGLIFGNTGAYAQSNVAQQAAKTIKMTPRNAIYHYAKTGNMNGLQQLKAQGYQIDLNDAKGNSALCEATWRGDRNAVAFLVRAGANTQSNCMQKIPQTYKQAVGLEPASVPTAATTGTGLEAVAAADTGLSTGAMVGIGIGAAALIGGGVALALSGGGGSDSAPVVCSGRGTQDADGKCVCNTGYAGDNCETCADDYGNHGTNECYADLGCVNGTQQAAACVCRTGWTEALCDTPAPCDGYEYTSCAEPYAPSGTCQSGDTPKYQCDNCIAGYGKYGTSECHATLGCKDGTQQGAVCVCSGNSSGTLCDECKDGYGFWGTNTCYENLSCAVNQHQEGGSCVCDNGYGFYGTSQCHTTLTCGTNEHQQGAECVCNAGYEKQNGVCVIKQQNVAGSGSIFKLGVDTGYKVYNNHENITVSLPTVSGFELVDNGTLINHKDITGTAAIDSFPLNNTGYTFKAYSGIQGIRGTLSATAMQNKFLNIYNNGNINLTFPEEGAVINEGIKYWLSGIYVLSSDKDTSKFSVNVENNGKIEMNGNSIMSPNGITVYDYWGMGTGDVSLNNTGDIYLFNATNPTGVFVNIGQGSAQVQNSGNIDIGVTQGNEEDSQTIVGIGASSGISLSSIFYDDEYFKELSSVSVNNTGAITLNVQSAYGDSSLTGISAGAGNGSRVENSGSIFISHADSQTGGLSMYGISSQDTDIINSGNITLSNSTSGETIGIVNSFIDRATFVRNLSILNETNGSIVINEGTGIKATYSNKNQDKNLDTSALSHSIDIQNDGTITIDGTGIGISLSMEDHYDEYLSAEESSEEHPEWDSYRSEFYPFKMDGILTNSGTIALQSGTGISAINEIDNEENIFNTLKIVNSEAGNIEIQEGTAILAQNANVENYASLTLKSGTAIDVSGIKQTEVKNTGKIELETGSAISAAGKVHNTGEINIKNFGSGIQGDEIYNEASIHISTDPFSLVDFTEYNYDNNYLGYALFGTNIINHGDIQSPLGGIKVSGTLDNYGDIKIPSGEVDFEPLFIASIVRRGIDVVGDNAKIVNSKRISLFSEDGLFADTLYPFHNVGIHSAKNNISVENKETGNIFISSSGKEFGIYTSGNGNDVKNFGKITVKRNSDSYNPTGYNFNIGKQDAQIAGIYNGAGSVLNQGDIELPDGGYGIRSWRGTVSNAGSINVSILEGDDGKQGSGGIWGDEIDIQNSTSGRINVLADTSPLTGIFMTGLNSTVVNEGDITVSNNAKEVYGIYSMGSVINTGNISVTSKDSEETIGIYVVAPRADSDPVKVVNVVNSGNIFVTTNGEISEEDNTYGIYAAGRDVKVYNTGTITVNGIAKEGSAAVDPCDVGTCYYGYNDGSTTLTTYVNGTLTERTSSYLTLENGEGYYAKRTGSGTKEDPYILTEFVAQSLNANNFNHIRLNDGATFVDGGYTNATATAVDFDVLTNNGDGNYAVTTGFSMETPMASGLIQVDNSVLYGDNKTQYAIHDAFKSENVVGLSLQSNSYLFNAALNSTSDTTHDIVMTMKSFDEVTSNKSLAAFLSENYALGNNEAFFNDIKSIGTAAEFTASMNDLTGSDTITRFTNEDLTVMREVNQTMNNLMFANNDKPMFETNGTVNAFGFKNDNNSSAQYALANKRITPRVKIGYAMSNTTMNTGDDNDNSRRNSVFQAFAPISYDRAGWQMIATPQVGFARGHYNRKGFNGNTYEGVIEKRIFALMNEARYPMTFGKFEIAPTVQFNAIAYNQKGSEEAKAYSLTMPSDNNLSVEAGLGLNARHKLGNLNLTAGLMLYREFADPYNVKMGMNGMDGTFNLYDDVSEYRGTASFGFDYGIGDLKMYGSLQHFVEQDSHTNFKAGVKYTF